MVSFLSVVLIVFLIVFLNIKMMWFAWLRLLLKWNHNHILFDSITFILSGVWFQIKLIFYTWGWKIYEIRKKYLGLGRVFWLSVRPVSQGPANILIKNFQKNTKYILLH